MNTETPKTSLADKALSARLNYEDAKRSHLELQAKAADWRATLSKACARKRTERNDGLIDGLAARLTDVNEQLDQDWKRLNGWLSIVERYDLQLMEQARLDDVWKPSSL